MSMHEGFERTYFLSYCQSVYDTDKAYHSEQTNRLNRHRHVELDSAQFLANIAMIRKPKKYWRLVLQLGFLHYGLLMVYVASLTLSLYR